MSDLFDAWLEEHLRGHEGGYSNDPKDAGGETNHGITVAVARAFGYAGPMRAMTWTDAKAIYEARYWRQPGYHWIADISAPVALALADIGINQGPAAAGTLLQRLLNVMNDGATRYPDVTEDGALGAMSRASLTAFLKHRGREGEQILIRGLTALRFARYVDLAERRPTDERFMYGWARRALLG